MQNVKGLFRSWNSFERCAHHSASERKAGREFHVVSFGLDEPNCGGGVFWLVVCVDLSLCVGMPKTRGQ
jgi:hypothetical protein